MKKVLLLMMAVLMVSSVAMADHIGVYSDATGSSCALGTGAFAQATVIQKFATVGSTGCRFKVSTPVGSVLFAFSTTFTPVGSLTNDLSLGFGPCLNGTIVLGTALFQNLAPGTLTVEKADGQTEIQWTDCGFGAHAGTGGNAYAGGTGNCGEVATEQSTWGQVKALYR